MSFPRRIDSIPSQEVLAPVLTYECDRCNYSTNIKNNLDLHKILKHTYSTDERPFKCNICDYSAKTQGNLKTHSKVHTKKKKLGKSLTNATFVIMQQPTNPHCKLIFVNILAKDPINVISAIVHSRVPQVLINISSQRSINATLWSTLRLND